MPITDDKKARQQDLTGLHRGQVTAMDTEFGCEVGGRDWLTPLWLPKINGCIAEVCRPN
jgi:hypothetical protein